VARKKRARNILNAEVMLSLNVARYLAGRFAAKTSMARVSLDFSPAKDTRHHAQHAVSD